METGSLAAPGLGGALLQTLLALAVVCGLAVLAIRVWAGRRPSRGRGGERMQLLSTLPLAGGASLQLVDAGGQRLLLGVTAASVRLVCRLPPAGAPTAVDDVSSVPGSSAGGSP